MDTTTAPVLTPAQILAIYHSASPADSNHSSDSLSFTQHPASTLPFTPTRLNSGNEAQTSMLRQCISPQEVFNTGYNATSSHNDVRPLASSPVESASSGEVRKDREAVAETTKDSKLFRMDSDFWDFGSSCDFYGNGVVASPLSSGLGAAFSPFSCSGSSQTSTSPSPLTLSKKAEFEVDEWDLTTRLLQEQSTSSSLPNTSQRIDHWGFSDLYAGGVKEGRGADIDASDHNSRIFHPTGSAAHPSASLQLPSWSGNGTELAGLTSGKDAVAATRPRGVKREREESSEAMKLESSMSGVPSLPIATSSKRPKIDPELVCRVEGCRHIAKKKPECHKHRDTHFDGRFQCPNTACATKFRRSSSLKRHLQSAGARACAAAAGDSKGWGPAMRKFESRGPDWKKDGFKLDDIEHWEFEASV